MDGCLVEWVGKVCGKITILVYGKWVEDLLRGNYWCLVRWVGVCKVRREDGCLIKWVEDVWWDELMGVW